MVKNFKVVTVEHDPKLGALSTWTCYCSVAQSCLTLCDPMDCSTPGFPVLHYLLEFAQIHVHWVTSLSACLFPKSDSSAILTVLWINQHPFNKILSALNQPELVSISSHKVPWIKQGDLLDSQTITLVYYFLDGAGWCLKCVTYTYFSGTKSNQ